MVLRFVVYWALGIDAALKHQFLLAVLCFGVPFGGPIGMWIATAAGLLFLIRGFYAESALSIGIVIFNVVGNQVLKKVKSSAATRLSDSFNTGERILSVSLYQVLSSEYMATLEEEQAKVLAAQVVNYLQGEDVAEMIRTSDEPLRSQIALIADQVPDRATKAMAANRAMRELIVAALRIKAALNFNAQGESYFCGGQHTRIEGLLSVYGPEFPETVSPDSYLTMATRFREVQRSTQPNPAAQTPPGS